MADLLKSSSIAQAVAAGLEWLKSRNALDEELNDMPANKELANVLGISTDELVEITEYIREQMFRLNINLN